METSLPSSYPYVFLWSNEHVKEMLNDYTFGSVRDVDELEQVICNVVDNSIRTSDLYNWIHNDLNNVSADENNMRVKQMARKLRVVKSYYSQVNNEAYADNCFFHLMYFDSAENCWKDYAFSNDVVREYVWKLMMKEKEKIIDTIYE